MAARLSTRIKDGKVHWARIEYRKPVMSVYLDDRTQPVLTAAVDLAPVLDSTGRAWVGGNAQFSSQ